MSKKTKKIILIALLMFLGSVAAFGFMVYRVIEQGEQLSEQIVLLNKENAQADSYSRLHKTALDTVDERDLLRGYFLDQEGDSIDFLNYVENLAEEISIPLETSELSVVEDKNTNTKWVKTTFDISASREEIQQFIEILETVPYVSRVVSTEMSIRSSTEWQAVVSMQVMVLGYEK